MPGCAIAAAGPAGGPHSLTLRQVDPSLLQSVTSQWPPGKAGVLSTRKTVALASTNPTANKWPLSGRKGSYRQSPWL